MKFQRIIVITAEENRYLQKLFGVSNTTVWQAVKYLRSTDTHRKIRKAAIERGNPQMVLAPEFETLHLTNREDADAGCSRYMVQTFENGSTLEANLTDGVTVVRDRRGEVKGFWENPRMNELKAIQEVAQSL